MRIVLVVLLLSSACAVTGGFSAGVTIDGDGHPGAELAGNGGEWFDGHVVSGQPEYAWMSGIELALGTAPEHPYASARASYYVEYLELGDTRGWHARLALGGSSLWGGALVAALTAGPYRIASGATEASSWHTDGIDVSLRIRLMSSRPGTRWQLAALYTRESSALVIPGE